MPSDDRNDELADLLRASVGINLGFAYLDDAREPTPSDLDAIPRRDAAAIVWLDGLAMNRDRTGQNPNLLCWRDHVWLIDHGAALTFHYAWNAVTEDAPRAPYTIPESHLLSERAGPLERWNEELATLLTHEVLSAAVAAVPDAFLAPLVQTPGDIPRRRSAYVAFLSKRLKLPRPFLDPVIRPSAARRGRPDRLAR